MSVIEPVEMVKIRFMEEWVSPTDHGKKAKSVLAARKVKISTEGALLT